MIKVLKKILNVIFIILIIILAGYFILRLTGRLEIYNVKTGSMEDNIHVNDYILIYKKDDYEIGDIVTFKKDNYLVTHRIIREENNKFVTKGDANNTEDDAISLGQIVGKVIIIGGVLNFIVNYKFTLAGTFLSLYLISCYFDSDKDDDENDIEEIDDEIDDE